MTSNSHYTPHCQRISIHQHYEYLATSGLMCDLGACLEDMLLNDARFIHPLAEHRRSAKLPRRPSPSTPNVHTCLCLTQLRTSNCHYVSHRHGLQKDMLLNDAKYIYPLVEHGWPAKLSRCPSSVVRRPMPLHTHIQLVPTIFRPDTAKWRKQGQGLRQHGTLQRSLSSMQTNAHKNVVLYTSTSSTQEGSHVSKMSFPSCYTAHALMCSCLNRPLFNRTLFNTGQDLE